MSEPLRFVVPMPPNLANGRMHHMVKHRLKEGYWAVLDTAVTGQARMNTVDALRWLSTYGSAHPNRMTQSRRDAHRIASWLAYPNRHCVKPPATCIAHALIRSVMYLPARMDAGNAMNRHKWVEDWLTTRGYIADDNPDALRWEGLPEQVVKRDGNYRIELTITPL